MAAGDSLDDLIRDLPPELANRVERYVRDLLSRQVEAKRPPRLKWAGALREHRDVTSVELQHKLLGWWGE